MTANDSIASAVNTVLDTFARGPQTSSDMDALRHFFQTVVKEPGSFWDSYLGFFEATGDHAKGREIIDKLGPDATFGDLAAFVKAEQVAASRQ